MFALPTEQSCAFVRFVKGLVVKGSDTLRNTLLFGIAHAPWIDRGDRRDLPTWVSDLMTRDEGNRTSLLLEVPPLPWNAVLDVNFGELAGADWKLKHLLKKVMAYTDDQSMTCQVAGVDLRYTTDEVQGNLQLGDKGYRHSLHDNLNIDNLTWMPTPSWLVEFWGYIVGATDDAVAYGQKVQQIIIATGGVRAARRTQILRDAAQICRGLYAGMPIEVRREVARALTALGLSGAESEYHEGLYTPQRAHEVKGRYGYDVPDDELLKTDFDSKPLGKAIITDAIALKLVDACILGWMLSPTEAHDNIVVVVGRQHVNAIIACVRHLAGMSLARFRKSESILTGEGDTASGSYLSKPVAID